MWASKQALRDLAEAADDRSCATEEGEDILDSLVGKTGSRTVPQVFVKSQYIGGCDGELAARQDLLLQVRP